MTCIHCGICERVCPRHLVKQGPTGFIITDPSKCNDCQACSTYCPMNIANHESTVPVDSTTIEAILKQRRSTKRFTSDPVSQDQFERIFRLIDYMPKNGNKIMGRFEVHKGQPIIDLCAKALQYEITDGFYKGYKWMQSVIDQYNNEIDTIGKNSPYVVLYIGDNKNHWNQQLSGIAYTYLNFACMTQGLGALYLGYMTRVANCLNQYLSIGNFESIYGIYGVGYPQYTAYNIPNRKQFNVKYNL